MIAHLYTALAYYVIGLSLLSLAAAIWWTHPVNRALLLGPFLTVDGLKLVLRLWPLVFLFGAFIFSCALDHHASWLAERGRISRGILDALALVEAIISVWTAASVLALLCYFVVRRWLAQ